VWFTRRVLTHVTGTPSPLPSWNHRVRDKFRLWSLSSKDLEVKSSGIK
jgi:hypothetical protein